MLDQPLRTLAEPALARAGRALGPRIGANALTLIAFTTGIVAIGCISVHEYWAGLALLVLNRILDSLALAVMRHNGETELSALLHTVLDVIVNAGVVLAFALAVPDRALAAAFLLFSLAILWAAALESSKGRETWSLIGHAETFIAFAIACINPGWFSMVCYVLGTLAFIGTGLRIAATARPRLP
ncbi:MAG TPA: hypothetical protein VHW02_15585 [Rhizomicrobium sp.]|jgi:hypothetical protein|nr:hypothetical protein [Rhizomicrobium sp.]